MIIILQLILYCLIFTGVVAFAVRGGAINGIYFYPKPVQERAFELGLIDRETIKSKKKQIMILLYTVLFLALLLIIGLWNGVNDFKTAFFHALLFLEVMNWYDGIMIDKVWVGHSKFWIIPGTEDLPFVPTWKQVLKKRGILTLIWPVGTAIVAGVIVLIF
jgi:hypothetical protein